jgi:hypothetical protein
VAPDYVSRILPLLDDVDQIGFRLKMMAGGALASAPSLIVRDGDAVFIYTPLLQMRAQTLAIRCMRLSVHTVPDLLIRC